MRMHEPALWICSLVSSAVVMAATVEAAVVTMRLSTGLRASSSGDGLPQAWAAPAKEPLAIDGRLDERAWEACPPVVLGKLERPGDTSPRSEVRFMHGRGMLYLGMKLTEPNIDKLKRSATTHDGPAWDDDSVELFLAPHANNEYYQIIASASARSSTGMTWAIRQSGTRRPKQRLPWAKRGGRWKWPCPWLRSGWASARPSGGA